MFDVRKYIRFPHEVDFESSRFQQNLSLATDPICNVELYDPLDNIVVSHLCERLLQTLVNLVTARASLFTDQRMSGSTNSCQIQVFQDNFREHTSDNPPTVYNSSSLKL